MDGYTTWACKQDLYRVQFALERMLKNCPTYSLEDEWLEEQRLEREKQQAAAAKNAMSFEQITQIFGEV